VDGKDRGSGGSQCCSSQGRQGQGCSIVKSYKRGGNPEQFVSLGQAVGASLVAPRGYVVREGKSKEKKIGLSPKESPDRGKKDGHKKGRQKRRILPVNVGF